MSLHDLLQVSARAAGRPSDGIAAEIVTEAERLALDPRLIDRPLNVDLSGGEKKKNETLQLGVLRPAIAVLDELDSGLDVDALRSCARRIEAETQSVAAGGRNLGVLAITHYNRLLHVLHADKVHVLAKGLIVRTGGPELALELEAHGYAGVVGADLAGEDEGTAVAVRPAIDDPFGGPGPAGAGDPFADPLA